MPLRYIEDHPCKYKRTGDSLSSSAAQWHRALKWFQWICPPPRWAIQIRPATSLTFIHIPLEIHPSVFFHSPPSCSLSPHEFLHPDTPRWSLHLLSTPLIFSSAVFLWFYSPSPLFRHASGERVFPILLPEKKNLSDFPLVFCRAMRIMVSQMNSVQEPGLIEKTQAWSAMKETVLVSQLNCANVLSRAGEGESERERERGKY